MSNVEHPSHYNSGKIETIELIEEVTNSYNGYQAFLVGNVIKYLARSPHKNGIEDLKKADYYMNLLLEDVDDV